MAASIKPPASKLVKSAAAKKPPNAGKGRVAGVPNKVTKQLKEMILGALDQAGGEAYLLKQSKQNPTAFLTLIGKVLPTTLQGDPNAPLQSQVEVRFVRARQDSD